MSGFYDRYPDWHHRACAHCGVEIADRSEVAGRVYCSPACGAYLSGKGECPCVALRSPSPCA